MVALRKFTGELRVSIKGRVKGRARDYQKLGSEREHEHEHELDYENSSMEELGIISMDENIIELPWPCHGK